MKKSLCSIPIMLLAGLLAACPGVGPDPAAPPVDAPADDPASAQPTYSVRYDGNGHSGGGVPTDAGRYVAGGVAMVASAGSMSRTGHGFAGWNTKAEGDGTDYAPGSNLLIAASDVTLFAKWTRNSYTVTFKPMNGQDDVSTTVLYGATATPPADPTDGVYSFAGWFEQISAWVEEWDPADPVTGDLTLYAKWPGVYTIAGTGAAGLLDGDGDTARFNFPVGLVVDSHGNVFVAEQGNDAIRKIAPDGTVSLFAGGTDGTADGTGAAAQFKEPYGIAIDADDNLYVADYAAHTIRKISPEAVVTTYAGDGIAGYADGDTPSLARFRNPSGVAVDAAGNVYVDDSMNFRIRKISPDGVVSTYAGDGTFGYADNAVATLAKIGSLGGLKLSADGTMYFADYNSQRIRKISPTGAVSSISGSGVEGYADGASDVAQFDTVTGIALSPGGTLYLVEYGNNRVRAVDTQTGAASTVAGEGSADFADGPAADARFRRPRDVAVAPDGYLLIADGANHRIRKIIW